MQGYKRFQCFQKGFLSNLSEDAIKVTYKPISQGQFEEGKKVGVTLLNRTTNPNYNLYRFEVCGHSQFLQPTHVRRNNIKCNTCFHSEIVKMLDDRDLHFVNNVGLGKYQIRKPCGCISTMSLRNAEHYKNIKCSVCFEKYLTTRSSDNGYEYLGEKLNGGYRKIRFIKCGHDRVVLQAQLQRGNVVCRQCIIGEDNRKIESQGLSLKKTEDERYSIYTLPCGHDKRLRLDHAKDGVYSCDFCDDSHYTKPSNIYLFKFSFDGFSWLKLGFAKEIKLRKNSYGLPKDTMVDIMRVIPISRGIDAVRAEKAIHRKFKQFRLDKVS
jgi:hypothetical protein